MQALVAFKDIVALKKELARTLPHVSSSHRAEALARGLGWNTYAAALAALNSGPDERRVTNNTFVTYLAEHAFPEVPFDTLGAAMVQVKFVAERTAITNVLEATPLLTRGGYGIYRPDRLTPGEREQKFQGDREQLLSSRSIDEFQRVVAFLAHYPKRGTINRRYCSYNLKHHAEQFCRERGHPDPYVSNGAFIAAAIHVGFTAVPEGANAYFNISTRSTPSARLASRPRAREQGWFGSSHRLVEG